MKRILSLLLALCATSLVFAQSLTVSSKSVVVNGPSNTAFSTHDEDTVVVHNVSGSAIDVKVKRIVLQALANTDNYFCWGITCYQPNTTISNNPVNMLAGDTSKSFSGYLDPMGTVGTAIIQYCFFNVANMADSACFVATYNAGTNGVNEMPAVKLSNPYPNPTSDNVNFTYSVPPTGKTSMKIYNMLGGLVKTVSITDNSGKLAVNTTDLRPGLYLYDLQVNGKSQKTGKFTVIQ